MTKIELTRRALVAGGVALAAAPAWSRTSKNGLAERVTNPLVRQRADTQIALQADGLYTFMASVPEYDRVILRRARTIGGLATAPETVLWRRPSSGRMAGHIWAPEIHQIDGRWYVYVAAGDGGDVFHIRTYVLQCDGADPVTGKWSLLGQLETPWDTFTLDSTTFVHRGTRYLAWAQKEPGIDTNSNLYLAPLATPTTLAARPVRLTVPTLPWEVQGFKVAEGPAPLIRNGRIFMTYSASATDARYCMGMLTARDDADLMDPAAWTKSPEPVFRTDATRHIYGPGHNSFTVDRAGRDVLVYHARDYERITGDPLYDPNRDTRVQRFGYRADGTPEFGRPVANGPILI
jgi:GH43 family beta-xylosidase